jgi:hypothetical protein
MLRCHTWQRLRGHGLSLPSVALVLALGVIGASLTWLSVQVKVLTPLSLTVSPWMAQPS